MTTIKSYTDINQSRKLAEILPIESADCYWEDDMSVEFGHGWHTQHIPCWSLAALLGVLPEGYSFELTKSFDGKDYYCNVDGKPIKTIADNPVDACVAMIEKLHEIKKL